MKTLKCIHEGDMLDYLGKYVTQNIFTIYFQNVV